MLPEDVRPDVADLLDDRRASHYWDAERALGRDVGSMLGDPEGIAAWDVFLVYGPDAKWGDRPSAFGSPVVSESDRLKRALEPYLAD